MVFILNFHRISIFVVAVVNLNKFKEPKHSEQKINIHLGDDHERLCLYVLNELDLLKEHVETRKLYNAIQPGLEQV